MHLPPIIISRLLGGAFIVAAVVSVGGAAAEVHRARLLLLLLPLLPPQQQATAATCRGSVKLLLMELLLSLLKPWVGDRVLQSSACRCKTARRTASRRSQQERSKGLQHGAKFQVCYRGNGTRPRACALKYAAEKKRGASKVSTALDFDLSMLPAPHQQNMSRPRSAPMCTGYNRCRNANCMSFLYRNCIEHSHI